MEVLLVGNKTDLENERQVSFQEGETFAKKEGIKFVEMSTKEYKKVEVAFNNLAESIMKKIDKGEIS